MANHGLVVPVMRQNEGVRLIEADTLNGELFSHQVVAVPPPNCP